MLQRTPIATRADITIRHTAFLANGRARRLMDDALPLDPTGIAVLNQDYRRVSMRWLIGSVLTALSGAVLLGSAIVISLQGEIGQVERPQKAVAPSDSSSTSRANIRRSDRLVRKEAAGIAARQEFKASMTVRTANREVIKTRDFVRVSAPLSRTTGTYARAIPPFNALNLFAEAKDNTPYSFDMESGLGGTDVSVVKLDLTPGGYAYNDAALNADEARTQAILQLRLMQASEADIPLVKSARDMLFLALRQNQQAYPFSAYASLSDLLPGETEISATPENVTLLPKQAPLLIANNSNALERSQVLEEYVVNRPGELAIKVLVDEGTLPDTARAILLALGMQEHDKLLKGQSLVILPTLDFSPIEGLDQSEGTIRLDTPVIGRVILREGDTIKAIAALTDDNRYVPVFLPQDELVVANTYDDAFISKAEKGPGTPLHDSLYETAARFGVPIDVVRALIPLFAADVDFQRRVMSGESLELLYTNVEEDGKPELLYAALTVEGETKRLYRFQSPKDNETSFFDPDGRSLRKFLIRKPITEGRLTSGFGMRYHPILHYAKLHTGIDWAFRVGTPIIAAGDGVLMKAGWHSGYGKRIEIQHANGYVSTYSHMSNFARGLKEGDRVKQGQVIGYLGSTGLSTGPHLHYEVLVNGRFVDPMKIKLPRSKELDGADLAEFMLQRDQVRELLAKAQSPT